LKITLSSRGTDTHTNEGALCKKYPLGFSKVTASGVEWRWRVTLGGWLGALQHHTFLKNTTKCSSDPGHPSGTTADYDSAQLAIAYILYFGIPRLCSPV
jgi:hypothetical protein